MKKFLLAVATALMSLAAANAQETMWGLTGGLNVSSFNGSDYNAKAGFNVGVKGEFDIAEPFFVEGSALLSGKGFKSDMGYDEDDDDYKVNLWYLHIPVNFGYKFDINDNMAIAPKVGVFVDLGLWGKDDSNNNPFSDYDDIAGMDNFNRFDFGFGFGANFWAAKHFEVSTGYELGMVDQYKTDSKSRNWYLSLAFLF